MLSYISIVFNNCNSINLTAYIHNLNQNTNKNQITQNIHAKYTTLHALYSHRSRYISIHTPSESPLARNLATRAGQLRATPSLPLQLSSPPPFPSPRHGTYVSHRRQDVVSTRRVGSLCAVTFIGKVRAEIGKISSTSRLLIPRELDGTNPRFATFTGNCTLQRRQ